MRHRRKQQIKTWAILAGSVIGAAWSSGQAMGQGVPSAYPIDPTAMPSAPLAPPAQGCSCGDRHGVSRHHHHRTVCKRKLQEKVVGFPEEFHIWPLGSSMRAQGQTMVDNGVAARMVFNQYDFVDGSAELKLRGRDKLAEMSRIVSTNFEPIIVERTPKTPGLDDARRLALIRQLAAGPFPVPPERVVVGPRISNGMMGNEATIVDNNRYGQVSSGTAQSAGTSTGAGAVRSGFDSSGLSGSAGR